VSYSLTLGVYHYRNESIIGFWERIKCRRATGELSCALRTLVYVTVAHRGWASP
jgi:hypothetical protein